MSQVLFMGHVSSDHRVGPAKVKVKAVVEVREPMTAAEVRSFLGLVNYSAIFIPDLATVSIPLRKNYVFRWGKSEQKSFNELKKRLASVETLGYYDKNAPTKAIADASPVGLGAVLVQELERHRASIFTDGKRSPCACLGMRAIPCIYLRERGRVINGSYTS